MSATRPRGGEGDRSMIRDDFEIAGGSVTGRAHALIGKTNQDACTWFRSDGDGARPGAPVQRFIGGWSPGPGDPDN